MADASRDGLRPEAIAADIANDGETARTIETSADTTAAIGSRALLLQMTTNLLHNAIAHKLPERALRARSPVIAARS